MPLERDVLVDIWLRSARATHTFLTEADIEGLFPVVREYLLGEANEFWVLRSEAGAIMRFMGMTGNTIDSLFLGPEYLRCGGGRRLVEHARPLFGELKVNVNEQNVAATRFYEACGFVIVGRSEVDGQGRPFPLLHMQWE